MRRLSPISLLGLLGLAFLGACNRAPEIAQPTTMPITEPTATPVSGRGGDSLSGSEAESLTAATGTEDDQSAEGRGIIYTIPFEVRPDGFGFRNYGPGYPEGDFTITELRALFGDGVCSRIEEDGDRCIPTAEAQQWIVDRNADMRVGHCIGFTVTSHLFSQGDLQPHQFASSADTPFELPQDVPIMRAIALNGSLYWVQSVWSSEVSGSPRDIIDALIALREPVDLSIFLPGLVGGHSVLAYGVEEVAPQQYHILVYDNNFPAAESIVEVDYAANTWRYNSGAVNPGQKAVPYEGDDTTETLRFIPLSAYETVTCPFCPAGEDVDSDDVVTLISVLGQGELLVKTALGSIGAVAGEIINEIPGARLIFPRGQFAANESPDIALPATPAYSLAFSGLERVSSQSPTFSLVVDNLTDTSDSNELVVAADAQTVDFQAGGEQSPLLNVTVRQEGASYNVALVGIDFEEGQSLSIGASESGSGLELRATDLEVSEATLLITRQTEEGEAIFATTDLSIEEDGGVKLDITGWDGSGSIDQYIDDDGDGTFDDDPDDLSNEPLADVLDASDPNTGAAIVELLNPVRGNEDLEALLAALPVEELTAREIGQLLQPMQLSDEQLIAYIPTLYLPARELAELLFALRLPTERLDTVIAALELEAEVEEALGSALADLVLFQEILSEWVFLNSDDMALLAGLLVTRDLTPEQLVWFLSRMELSEDQIEAVLIALALPEEDLVAVVEQLGVSMPATPTPSPTDGGTEADPAALTSTPTLTPTVTPTIALTATEVISATPTPTTTLDPYPEPPQPTETPDPYAYPVESPTPTPDGEPYPGPTPSPTPDFQSEAFCEGDDLQIVAEEPSWIEAEVAIWSGEELLFSGETGPEGEPFRATISGPGTWESLYIESSIAPERVPLNPITCPGAEPESTTRRIGSFVLALFAAWP